MGKYLMVVLMFLIAGMVIAVTRSPPTYTMFYSMLAGAIIIIAYGSWNSRKEHQRLRRERRKSKK